VPIIKLVMPELHMIPGSRGASFEGTCTAYIDTAHIYLVLLHRGVEHHSDTVKVELFVTGREKPLLYRGRSGDSVLTKLLVELSAVVGDELLAPSPV